jgi:ABC-type branched-subunit amino acid transport system ATPase component
VDKNHRAVTAHADRAVLPAKGRMVFDGVAESLAAQPELLRPHLRV